MAKAVQAHNYRRKASAVTFFVFALFLISAADSARAQTQPSSCDTALSEKAQLKAIAEKLSMLSVFAELNLIDTKTISKLEDELAACADAKKRAALFAKIDSTFAKTSQAYAKQLDGVVAQLKAKYQEPKDREKLAGLLKDLEPCSAAAVTKLCAEQIRLALNDLNPALLDAIQVKPKLVNPATAIRAISFLTNAQKDELSANLQAHFNSAGALGREVQKRVLGLSSEYPMVDLESAAATIVGRQVRIVRNHKGIIENLS